MRILVTGANGQLGNEMQVLAKENPQHTYYFTDVQELDICNKVGMLWIPVCKYLHFAAKLTVGTPY